VSSLFGSPSSFPLNTHFCNPCVSRLFLYFPPVMLISPLYPTCSNPYRPTAATPALYPVRVPAPALVVFRPALNLPFPLLRFPVLPLVLFFPRKAQSTLRESSNLPRRPINNSLHFVGPPQLLTHVTPSGTWSISLCTTTPGVSYSPTVLPDPVPHLQFSILAGLKTPQ